MDSLTFATWNVNSLRVRLQQVRDWLSRTEVDVLVLQETKVQDAEFPLAVFNDIGYHAVYSGQKSYNGVAILSKMRAKEIATSMPGIETEQKRFIGATIGQFRVLNFYVVNGASVTSEKFTFKMEWLVAMRRFLQKELSNREKVLVLGDFNIAPADQDVHDPKLWAGDVPCSEKERSSLRAIFDLGLCDVFRELNPDTEDYSWWDYRRGSFRRNAGLRIDLILATDSLLGACEKSWIDKEPRTMIPPSDHTPVLAQFRI